MYMLPAPDSYRSIFRHSDGTYDWKTELDYGWALIDKASCGSLAAVILEPILSAGGMITLPAGYLKAMKQHCEARGMLLIVDEAQTAMGRCGDLFAIEHPSNDGVVPDILTLSKTLGNGLPLSAVIASNAVAQAASEQRFIFYTTHANDPLPAAVGLKVLSIVLRDSRALVIRARHAGEKLHAGLLRLKSRFACIGEVRGRGLMAGIEIVQDRRLSDRADVELGKQLSARMMSMGLSAMISARDVFSGCIRIAPPIVITDEELQWGLDIMEKAFNSCDGSLPIV
jgi:4-aminobutyrate aminotransferase-like enzyme